MTCKNCGGTMIGDGVRFVLHCEFAEEETYWEVEPDAGPIYCKDMSETNVNEKDRKVLQDHEFIAAFDTISRRAYQINAENGFWDVEQSGAEFIALCHSELSEALEAMRNHNPPDAHCPDFTSVEVELADCIIRIMDRAHRIGFRVAPALVAKLAVNAKRGRMHGGKKF